ncbi:hypothetical protein [Rhabdonatronobacter sediminivivens]|nr:hypothetical protein [Rhabdonatronobacter sediminivivens]
MTARPTQMAMAIRAQDGARALAPSIAPSLGRTLASGLLFQLRKGMA